MPEHDIQEIIFRLKNLQPGEKITYYEGCLASNRATLGSQHTAITAMDLYQRGHIHLIQQRLGPPRVYTGAVDWEMGQGPGFRYMAVGRSRSRKAPTFGAHLRTVLEEV